MKIGAHFGKPSVGTGVVVSSAEETLDISTYQIYRSGDVLYFRTSSGTDLTLGGAGGAVPNWETIYAYDTVFPITAGTWSITQSAATGLLSLNKTNVGAGTVLAISNSGSGKDITGSAWSIVTAGAVGVLELTSGGTINATDGALSIGKTGTATTLVGTATVAEGLTVTAGGAVVTSGDLTVTSGNVIFTLGNLTLTNGVTSLTSTSNTAAGFSVINNTITTYGAAAASGSVEFRSTSLTTGTLLHLELTEGTLNGGYYARAWDLTAGGAVWSLGEDGNMVIAGTASGTAALTCTSGDILVSSGDVTVSLGSVSVTNTANETVFTVVGDAVTDGIVLDINADGITTGTILHLDSTAAGFSGKYIDCFDGAASDFAVGLYGATTIAGNAASTVFTVTAGDLVVSDGSLAITDADDAATFSVTNNSAITAPMMVLASSGAHSGSTTNSLVTLTSGATTGTVAYIAAAAVTTGKVLHISATAATDAYVVDINGGGANMSATGIVVGVSMGAATVGSGVSIRSTGVYAGTTGLLAATANSMTTGKLAVLSATGQTSGVGLEVTGGGANLTTGKVVSVAMGAATAGTGVDIVSTGVYTGTTGLLNVTGSSATTGVLVNVGAAGLTSGTALKITATEATLTTGKYVEFYDGAANDFSVAKYGATIIAGNAQGTAALTVTAGDLVLTAGNATVGGKMIFSGTETIAAGGTTTALSLTKTVHYIDADAGGDIFTLADGVAGQIMTILLTSSTGTATITPANLAGGTSVTLNADGDTVVLQFMDTEWFILGGNSYAVI